jgi:hypothetical protein
MRKDQKDPFAHIRDPRVKQLLERLRLKALEKKEARSPKE